jgi:hypothetical protein
LAGLREGDLDGDDGDVLGCDEGEVDEADWGRGGGELLPPSAPPPVADVDVGLEGETAAAAAAAAGTPFPAPTRKAITREPPKRAKGVVGSARSAGSGRDTSTRGWASVQLRTSTRICHPPPSPPSDSVDDSPRSAFMSWAGQASRASVPVTDDDGPGTISEELATSTVA